MEKKSLILRYEPLKRALKALESSVIRSNDPDIKDPFYEIRDSKIQRFEYTLDIFWKYLSDYLSYEGIDLRQINPKDILRAAQTYKIIDEREFNTLMNAVNDRNATSHKYGEEIADKVAESIDIYYGTMAQVTTRLEPKD